jgi:hypothetical protein
MKAYDISMGLIFINAGIYLVATMNLFGDLSGVTGLFESLSIFYEPVITIAGVPIKGIDALAVALAAGTVVVLNSNAINDRGIAMAAFSIIFWGSFGISSLVFVKLINDLNLPGIAEFYSIFLLASTFIFVMTLVQMPTGGQKSFE